MLHPITAFVGTPPTSERGIGDSPSITGCQKGVSLTFSEHVVRWDLGRDLAFCARQRVRDDQTRDHSELALWRYDHGAGALEQVAEAQLRREVPLRMQAR